MEKASSELAAQRDEDLKAQVQLQENMEKASSELAALEGKIKEAERQALERENEIRLTESVLMDIKSSGDKLERELASIKQEKENSQAMIEKIEKSIEDKTVAIKDAENASQEKLDQYNSKKAEFDTINEEVTKARIDVSSCEQEKEYADSTVERIQTALQEVKLDIEAKSTQQESLREEKLRITQGHADYGDIIKEKEEERQRQEEYLEEVTKEKNELSKTLSTMTERKEELTQKLQKLQDQKYELEIKKAKNETQLDTYKNKLWEDFEVSYIQAMEFKSDEFVMSTAVKENRRIKERIRELGEVNVGAIEEYEIVKERYDFLTGQRADIQEAMDNLNSIITDMDKTIKVRFKESFDQIVINFEEKFQELFGGGHAELRLSDENNPLESSIDIIAQPPGKKLQNINLLSGGEKTLTAIALMFAVLKAKPTPFCILDEVEAALDDANIDRFINCVRTFGGIQFTLVTHQKSTMEHADVLYGVTMPEKGVSKVLSLDLGDDFEI
jgi:chromosome segregation protein